MRGRTVERHHPACYSSRRWRRLRDWVFTRDRWRCRACGKAGRLECDHVRPIQQGGAQWDAANLQALCRGCHFAKTYRERHPAGEHPDIRAWRALTAG